MTELMKQLFAGEFTAQSYFICLGAALICGIICAAAASFKARVTKSFAASLILLPMIVETVILMVNGNVGTGVAVMGAFSLVRFRSAPGRAKDISAIFLAMTAGLACGAGYPVLAIIFTAVVSSVMVIISFIPMGSRTMNLSITIPESLNFAGAFDGIFEKYTRSCNLVRTKTTNMGSLYRLTYRVELRDKALIKDFIDELRARNGNLEISLCETEEAAEEL